MTDILIVKHGALGDVVRTAFALPGLHKKYGAGLRVWWLTAPAATDLLRFNPWVYKILTSPLQIPALQFAAVYSFDDELDAATAATAAKMEFFLGARIETDGKVGYSDNSAPWFDMGLCSRFGKARADQMKIENQRSHAQIYAAMMEIEIARGDFHNSAQIESRWRCEVRRDGHFHIGLNPFAGGRWKSKALPDREVAPLLQALVDARPRGLATRITLFGEGDQHAQLAALAKPHGECVWLAHTSESILELAAGLAAQDYLISTDSLALHLAVARNVKNLSFYAPTSAAEIETFGLGVKVISTSPDYCNYQRDADNSSITAKRIMSAFEQSVVK